MKTKIPFSGFYQSLWDLSMDDAHTRLVEERAEESGEPDGAVSDALFHSTRYTSEHFTRIAQAWTSHLVDEIDRLTPAATFITFDSLWSPKEYNFDTDEIIMTLPRETVRFMRSAVSQETLDRIAADRHTSRSGFHSFYTPDVRSWGRVDQWGINQVSTLLLAYLDHLDINVDYEEERCIDRLQGNGFFDDLLHSAQVTA